MAMPAIKLKEDEEIWTYANYLHLPNDGKTYQIIGGNLIMSPAPSLYHQSISRNLEFIIWEFVKEHDLGEVFDAPVDVIFSPINVTQPDIVYISKSRLNIAQKTGIFGPPDWIVEIVSPSNSEIDIRFKHQIYKSYGVKEYWIVNPEEEMVNVYILKEGGYTLKGVYLKEDTIEVGIIPGLKVDLTEVF